MKLVYERPKPNSKRGSMLFWGDGQRHGRAIKEAKETYSIEVAVVDEEALRVRDLHGAGALVDDTRRVVGLALRDRVGQPAAAE